jgi:hypothetical protein
MLIGLPFHSNQIGLTALLINLQTQTTGKDIIMVCDNSPSNTGLGIVRLYGGSKTPILIELGKHTIYQSWNLMLKTMVDQDQEGCLILNDDVLLSNTCILNLKRAHNMSEHLCLTTKTPDRAWTSRRLDPNFSWYNRMVRKEDIVDTQWMPGFAFYLKRECIEQKGYFSEDYQIWFADTEYEARLNGKIGRLENEYIYHFGSSSFNYKDKEVQEVISKDRTIYASHV